ncbi:hypothetical protein QZR14_19065 [Pseudomonas sp. rhizo66]|uniref:hypothetical protein n=1 Tax=Pseudomonas sp. rhizo66 TaxID=3059674 RepID=UPI00288CC5E4|nr:hypothetical protein [Pseudomonas sp. rhizo66]MDT3313467.1 hypothetical protein [Pseudomonas sp. rhizo66]
MLSKEQKQKKELSENTKDTGTFDATDGAGWTLKSTQVLFVPTAYPEFWVLGLDQYTPNLNAIIFAIPKSLSGYTPHTIYFDDREWVQKWEVDIEGETYPVESGWVNVELRNSQKTIVGTLEFILKEDRKITGSFHIFS